ncbi:MULTISPECIES: helix-turn-helix transcriptional regulator [Erwinia]|uniref:helix-turn-helix domain-containing protein n=1 Tax=Erwinia TaxID=551 RepID=UPI00054D4D78|nr:MULTISPECIES: helix-turn-helix transcriptional regulator [Erwinia]
MRFSTMSDSEIIAELCHRIKETRMQLGLSQIELAERSRVGIATIKRVELGESVTLSTLIGLLRGLESLHQLESILFDSHIRTFNAQFSKDSCARIRIRKKQTPLKERCSALTKEEGTKNESGINEWFVSSATSNLVWSFGSKEPEK